MQPNLTLFHYWRSSCSWRLRWALELKSLKYKSVAINLLEGEHKKADYLKRNPAGFVPCLEINGAPFGESLALIEWLDEVVPTPALLPQDPLSRIKARQLALTVVAGTQPLQNLEAQKYFSDDPQKRTEYAKHWIKKGLKTYEILLRQFGCAGTFSLGGQVTVADLCLVPQVYNAMRFNVDMDEFSLCHRIYKNSLATKECDKAAPHNQPGATK